MSAVALQAHIDQALAGLREALNEGHRRGYPVRVVADSIAARGSDLLPPDVADVCIDLMYRYVDAIESGGVA